MAINIDTVYQRVLAIANKEQRGYITPLEFNLFANQAQMDIFDEYFYALNQAERAPGTNLEYSDKAEIIEEKISFFQHVKDLEYDVNGSHRYSSFTITDDIYKLGTVYYSPLGEQLVTDPYAKATSGTDLVTNGNFTDSNTGSNGWSASNQLTLDYGGTGLLISNNSNSSTFPTVRSADITLVPGQTYRLRWRVISVNKGANTVTPGKSGNPKIFMVSSIDGHYRPLYHDGGLNNVLFDEGYHSRYFTWDLPAHNNDPNNFYFTQNNGNTKAQVVVELANANQANMSCRVNEISIEAVGTSWVNANRYLENGWSIGKQYADNTKKFQVLSHNSGPYNSYLSIPMALEEGCTYALTFSMQEATSGRLLLANHLQETTDVYQIGDGANDNLLLWHADTDTNGTFTRYWRQGPSSTTVLRLWAAKNSNFMINRIGVRKISDLQHSSEVDIVSKSELKEVLNSRLLQPSLSNPVYTRSNNGITIHPTSISSGVRCNFIKKPEQVNWAYTEINGSAMYNANNSVNFELHESEEKPLVSKILSAAGVVLKDPLLIQESQKADIMDTQMKKQ